MDREDFLVVTGSRLEYTFCSSNAIIFNNYKEIELNQIIINDLLLS